MSMSSFYGGRQGASFIIVKRFDGISIPDFTPKEVYYAVNENNILLYPFIEKDSINYGLYAWKIVSLDGSTVEVILEDETPSQQVLDIVYQEGMVECFKQGGDTTDIVNYGEYVIIDTISKDNPDNGKVYRRGMNFDYNPDTNPLAGAEYIGQIVGPAGDTVDFGMLSYQDVEDSGAHKIDYFLATEQNEGIIPGYDENTDTYNDDIKFVYATIRDEFGNAEKYVIGFKFPYTYLKVTSTPRDSYYKAGDNIPEGKRIGDIIDDTLNLITRTDDGTHPFYKSWHLDIPRGTKGDSVTDLQTYPKTIPAGTMLYEDSTLTIEAGPAPADTPVDIAVFDDNTNYVTSISGLYTYKNSCYQSMRYREITFDYKSSGNSEWHDVNAEWVSKVRLDENGRLHYYYNNGREGYSLDSSVLKGLRDIYIDTEGEDLEEGTGDQRVHITYNTGEQEVIGRPLNYIVESVVTEYTAQYPNTPGYHLLVYYSDPAFRDYLKITYPDKIKTYPSVKEEGVIRTEWYDAGYVKGDSGGVHFIGNFDSLDDLYKDQGHTQPIPPEEIGHVGNPDYDHAGWNVTIQPIGSSVVTIYAYDYLQEEWYSIGTIDSSVIDPSLFFTIAPINNPPASLKNGGLWFIQSSRIFIE